MTRDPEARYYCERCGARYQEPGDCPDCDEEPLLDLKNPQVILLLQSFDEQAWRSQMGRLSAVAAVICSPLLVVLFFGGFFALPVFGAATMGLSAVLYAFFPAKKVTPDDTALSGRRRGRHE